MAVVTTGFFDGVHLGHRAIIDTLVRQAREAGEESVIVTFWPHPRAVLRSDARNLKILSTRQEKYDMLRSSGVDRVEVLPFTQEFAAKTTKEYLQQVVKERLSGSKIVLGYDNYLGADLLSVEDTCRLAESLGLKVVTPVPVNVGELTVSSTKIRKALEEGDIKSACGMLGHPYCLAGVVVPGNHLGRKLGFPTANMQLYEPLKLVPGNGVYLVKVKFEGESYYGMTNIGVRPTVSEGGSTTIETHIFNFDEDIYGLDLNLEFVVKIRDEVKFESLEELSVQLGSDKVECEKLI